MCENVWGYAGCWVSGVDVVAEGGRMARRSECAEVRCWFSDAGSGFGCVGLVVVVGERLREVGVVSGR